MEAPQSAERSRAKRFPCMRAEPPRRRAQERAAALAKNASLPLDAPAVEKAGAGEGANCGGFPSCASSPHFADTFCRNTQGRVYFVCAWLPCSAYGSSTPPRAGHGASRRVWNPGLLTRLATKLCETCD